MLKGRLHPGRMFLVDIAQGRIVDDEELKHRSPTQHRTASGSGHTSPRSRACPSRPASRSPTTRRCSSASRRSATRYEDLKSSSGPMGNDGEEPIGSMGTDTPLAVLSDRAAPALQLLQAALRPGDQPPARRDPRGAGHLGSRPAIGGEGNLLEPTPESCRQIALKTPILDNDELARISHAGRLARVQVGHRLPMLFPAAEGAAGAGAARSTRSADRPSQRDRRRGDTSSSSPTAASTRQHAPIPSLLADGGLHHHLVREGTRTQAGLVIECGDAREVHHFALLLGYGAGAINPYLAFETLDDMIRQGLLPGHRPREAVKNYRKAIKKGVVKVMSKMGICTIQSYRGAQIFEAIGLNQEFVDRYFNKTASRIGGVGLDEIADGDARPPPPRLPGAARRRAASSTGAASTSGAATASTTCSTPRRSSGSSTPPEPASTRSSRSTRTLVDDQNERLCTLRGLFDFKPAGRPVPIEEVEPVESIVKRFATGAMSYGSISQRGARDPGHRHEPHRRQVATPARAARTPPASSPTPNGDCAAARSSRSPRAGSA